MRLLYLFLLSLFAIPVVLCQNPATLLHPTLPRDVATISITSNDSFSSTVLNTPLPTGNDPITTDVCGLSLVSPNEQNQINLRKCKCSDLDMFVDCGHLDLTELPKLISFPKTARNVVFAGNKIKNIGKDTFYNGRYVIELDLSYNEIDFISSVAFNGFKSLKSLDLSHNKIWNMPLKSFQGLGELQFLDLGYNDLGSISSDLFAFTPGLKELSLESNHLQELEPKVFEHLPKLEILSLESTMLQVIPDHIFVFTPSLKLLDLSNNQLTEVPSDALKVLDHLKIFELSGNPIGVIKEQAFLGMRGLVLLYLDRMPRLTKIEKYAFGDLQQLQELHCSYNFLLSEIDVNAFVRKVDNYKVPLSQLFLRQNDLNTLPKDLLNWNDAVELHIGGNSLSCDCRIEWMVTMKLKNNFQSHAKCYTPSHLESLTLSQLKDHKLSCGLDLSEIVVIAVSVIAAILLLALIVAFLVWRRNYTGYSRPYYKVSKKKHVEDVDYRGDDCI